MQSLRGHELIRFALIFAGLAALTALGGPAHACTSILVTRGASVDGSVIITYSCDDAGNYCTLGVSPAADHKPGEMIEIVAPDPKGEHRKIPQVAHTNRVFCGLMNEYQLSMSETTFGGRPELVNPQGLFSYGELMMLGLQRTRTAREAIKAMIKLVDDYGYGDTGESISVADPNEAWILEIVGTGPGGKGAAWVAVRIPDGQISCHTNISRIGEIPRDDPVNWMHSDNVESFAASKGWYDPKSGKPFRFNETYDPPTPFASAPARRGFGASYRRAAPSQNFSPDYHRSKPGSQPYPLWIKPDHKLSAANVVRADARSLRRHAVRHDPGRRRRALRLAAAVAALDLEDRRRGLRLGAAHLDPAVGLRQRHAIANWLPNPVGGLIWYCVDDSYTSCFLPFYCSIESLPQCFMGGSIKRFSWGSAWWVFNLAANLAYAAVLLDHARVAPPQQDIESNLMALQPAVEKTAVELSKTSPSLANRYLTDYSVMHAELTFTRWQALVEHLITKYNDGYIRDERLGKSTEVGYPEAWLRRVVREQPDRYPLPVEKPGEAGTH